MNKQKILKYIKKKVKAYEDYSRNSDSIETKIALGYPIQELTELKNLIERKVFD